MSVRNFRAVCLQHIENSVEALPNHDFCVPQQQRMRDVRMTCFKMDEKERRIAARNYVREMLL